MGAKLSYPAGVDLKGKVAIVTGGNAGIGYETAKALAFMGAHVILACRSEERAQLAIDSMKESAQSVAKEITVEFMTLDLASLLSTKNFIENFKHKNLPLNLLICNAGIAIVAQGKTQDNFERHFQVNHLGHFLVCLELFPCMVNTEGDKRIVMVSSLGHKSGVWDPANLQGDTDYGRLKFYGNSKLYNIMMAAALQRRVKDCGITVSSLHPGTVRTEIYRNYEDIWWLWYLSKLGLSMGLGRSVENGAMTTINCAVNPALNTQQSVYYSDCVSTQPSATASNEQYQEELWDISCELLKEWMSQEAKDKFGSTGKEKKESIDDDKRQEEELTEEQ